MKKRKAAIMQRKCFILSAFILSLGIPLAAHAEDGDTPPVNIGVRAALGWADWFRGAGRPGVASSVYRRSFYAGISSSLDFYDSSWARLGIQVEALFIRRGTVITYAGSELDTYRMDYLDLPILARSLVRIAGPVSVHAVVGPRVGILLSASRTDVNGHIQDQSGFDRLDAGGTVGLGVAFDVSSRYMLTLEARYDQGFTNIDDGLMDNPGRRNRTFFITAGTDMRAWSRRPPAHGVPR